VCDSRDLHRALQQKKIFRLDMTPFKPEDAPSIQSTARVQELEQDNRELRRQLQASERQKQKLEGQLESMQGKLDSVLEVLARIEKAGPVVVNGAVVAKATEAVGGDTPTFIPDQITPEDAETQIVTDEGTTEGSKVTDAASRLRELRRQQAGETEDLDFG